MAQDNSQPQGKTQKEISKEIQSRLKEASDAARVLKLENREIQSEIKHLRSEARKLLSRRLKSRK
ncbi:MAG: hypothetical protein QM647_08845 [Asticcacaulis sp.]|uniref:hypothetical protein n=1 Tax=Asticcacaulis sp. TaxID=1872648 RepID=UPI0039E69A43